MAKKAATKVKTPTRFEQEQNLASIREKLGSLKDEEKDLQKVIVGAIKDDGYEPQLFTLSESLSVSVDDVEAFCKHFKLPYETVTAYFTTEKTAITTTRTALKQNPKAEVTVPGVTVKVSTKLVPKSKE